MTYPANPAGTNQWGGWALPTTGGTPPPTGQLAPPQSPSGSVTGEAGTWEFTNSELATTYYTSNLVSAAHNGTAFGSGDEPSPGLNVAETTPNPPSGSSYEQQGAVAISNLVSITASYAGIAPASIQVNNFGATGNV
jgi:hypothetical protein